MSLKDYVAVKGSPGITKHTGSGHYHARKKIKGKFFRETFETLYDAKLWRATFDGTTAIKSKRNEGFATLREVWEQMQAKHFPLCAPSTRAIWLRRFALIADLEHLPMNEITQSVITSWIQKHVKYFKGEDYESLQRGNSKRCNLDNELNLFTTIFNWYKGSEEFEKQAHLLINPIRKVHFKQGFVQPVPVKDRSISLDAALKFFQFLKQPYRDLALFQYFTASRISEAAGLQWDRIDFKKRQIVVMETCYWDASTKMFVELNKTPKNKTPRFVYLTEELAAILERQLANKIKGNNFVFHAEGKPLNYCTIQSNFRGAQRMSGIPYRGTHILRHGMAKLARQIGGGLDAVVAMTGHKDFKLADHYSKLDNEYQQKVSTDIMAHIRKAQGNSEADLGNVIELTKFARAR